METESSRGFEEFLLATLKDITRKLGVSNSSTCCSDPVPPSCPPCRWGKFTAALLLKLRRGVVRKKKTLSEINVAAQRAFTIALWSIYIENTIKLSQGEKRKPHVHSVWSPRSPGTSIACLFSSALLWHQIIKKGREHDAISINTWTSGLLKKQKKSSAKKSFSRATAFLKEEFNI